MQVVDGRRLPNFEPSSDPGDIARTYDPPVLTRLAEEAERVDPDAVISASQPIRHARVLTAAG